MVMNGWLYGHMHAEVNTELAIEIWFPSHSDKKDARDIISLSRPTTMSAFKTKNLYHLRISANSVLPLYVKGCQPTQDNSNSLSL